MSSRTYNAGSTALQNGTVAFLTDTIELLLLKSTYTMSPNDVNGTPAASEITGVSGYTGGFGGAGRAVLGTKSITNDTTNNRTAYGAANPAAWTLGTGDTIGGACVQKKGSASDATAIPLFWLQLPSAVPTNGSQFSISFPSGLIAWTQQ